MRMTDEQFSAHQAWKEREAKASASRARIDAFVATEAAKPAPKYRNQPTDGYASKREAKRAAELKRMEAAGEITDLSEQVKFVLIHKQDGERECTYTADFAYRTKDGEYVVEDSKGAITQQFVIRRKLMLFVHKLRVRQV